MMAGALALIASGALLASAAEDPQLAGIRSLAARMLKTRTAGPDSAFCEYAPISQVDGCSGPARNALRHRIGRKGAIETWVYRSHGEGGGPIGYYRGQAADKEWRALLDAVSRMRPDPGQSGIPAPPPPGPTESIPILTLSDGKDKAAYGKPVAAQGSIAAPFDQIALLARKAKDTVWQLSLVNPKAEVRKDSLHVTAEWKWRGPAGARILFSRPAEGDLCGTAAFKWFLDTSEFTVDWRRASMTPAKGRDSAWDLPGKAGALKLVFPYDGPKGKPKAKRTGMLEGIGIRLVPGGTQDTVQATVATDRFDF